MSDELREGLVGALMTEVLERLKHLVADDSSTSIDLSTLPLTAAERGELMRRLGSGEVQATLEVAGKSVVRETGFAGVWWVEHRGADGAVVSECLEVRAVPQILEAHPDDVRAAAVRLAAQLNESAGAPAEEGER